MRSTSGEPGFKRVELKFIFPEGNPPIKETVKAGAGRIFTPNGIDDLLDHVAENLEKHYPHWEFRLAPVGPNAFNFIYAGLRENPATEKGEQIQ